MIGELRILAVGDEPPPLDSEPEPHQEHLPPAASALTPSKGRRRAARGPAAGRFQTLNTFVDGTLRGLGRSDIGVWLVLYRDCRDGIARTSLADMARRG